MLPTKGDSLKFTDNFINNSPVHWTAPFHNVELDVIDVKLVTMIPQAAYFAYFMVNGLLNRIKVDAAGAFIDGTNRVHRHLIVFEDYAGSSTTTQKSVVAVPTPAWVPGAPPQSKATVSEDDRCKGCGQMGQIKGFS